MKIVVAIDSFKGSATSSDLNASAARAIKLVVPSCEVQTFPIADGGEGTLEALQCALGGELVEVRTLDLMERPIITSYLIAGQQALIESAFVVGIDKIVPSTETFEKATSFGLGAVICDAVRRGCQEIFLTLGGSGISDGGLGLLRSFGFDGQHLKFDFPDGWSGVRLVGLTDVKNVYAGKSGFAKIFGKQKGGSPEQIALRDQAARDFVSLCKAERGVDLQKIAGTGAAGGLGGALVLLGGRLESGFDRIAATIGLENEIQDADLVITGEGRLDGQSKEGKVPFGVAQLAKKYEIPVIAVCGAIASNTDWIWEEFLSVFSIQTQVVSLDEAMERERTLVNLEFVMRNILRIFMNK